MTTVAGAPRRVSVKSALIHTAVIAKRNVLRIVRLPQLLVFSTIQPVMFLLLFNFVFGGAIDLGAGPVGAASGEYINWLIPGILVQSAIFGATATSIGLTEDLTAGVIDRFRSLPMARSGVLTGRTLADLVRNTFVNSLMLGVGFLMGWRFEQGVWRMILGVALALLLGYAFSWVMASMGLAAKTPESAQAVAFPVIFPLVFASSVFVPTRSMPDWLRVFADNQPVTVIANAVRSLMIPEQALSLFGLDQGPLVVESLIWIAAIVIVFGFLSVHQYKRAVG